MCFTQFFRCGRRIPPEKHGSDLIVPEKIDDFLVR
jgi:hypothetical protein